MGSKPVPGPQGHPLFGNIQAMAANPAEFLLRTTNDFPDIAHFRLLHIHYYLVSKPEYIQDVLVGQHDKFRKSRRDIAILSKFLGKGILVTDGAYHKRQRKMVQPAFHTSRIQAYASTMVDYTNRLLDAWEDGSVQPINEAMQQ